MVEEKEKNKSVSGQISGILIDPGDKLKQFTTITRFQAEIFPLFDVIIAGRRHIIDIAAYNQNPIAYKKDIKKLDKDHPGIPIVPDFGSILVTSIAEWQRSLGKENFANKLSDLALADIESQRDNEGIMSKYDYPDGEE